MMATWKIEKASWMAVVSARREATDLPPEEVANAAQHLLSQSIRLPLDDLIRDTARLLGYQRTGQRVEQAMRRGLALLLARHRAREADGMILHQPSATTTL